MNIFLVNNNELDHILKISLETIQKGPTLHSFLFLPKLAPDWCMHVESANVSHPHAQQHHPINNYFATFITRIEKHHRIEDTLSHTYTLEGLVTTQSVAYTCKLFRIPIINNATLFYPLVFFFPSFFSICKHLVCIVFWVIKHLSKIEVKPTPINFIDYSIKP